MANILRNNPEHRDSEQAEADLYALDLKAVHLEPAGREAKTLSLEDETFLKDRESAIENNINIAQDTFFEIGCSLLEIRNYREGILYKKRYGTFEAYCRQRWDIGRSHAYRLIDASVVLTDLSPRGGQRIFLVPKK
jgi:hypothetical protein